MLLTTTAAQPQDDLSAAIMAAASAVLSTRAVFAQGTRLLLTDSEAPPIAVAACEPGLTFLNASSCSVCDGCYGKFRLSQCVARADTVCVAACLKGTYGHHGGAAAGSLGSCTRCGAGKYSAASGQTACLACPAGTFSGGAGATACAACALGNASSTGAAVCSQVIRLGAS